MTGVLMKKEDIERYTDTHREESRVITKTEIGVL